MQLIVMDMRKRRLEWFGHVTRRYETVNIRAVSETKMEGKRPRERRRLRWKDTVRRDMKAWMGHGQRKGPATPHRETVTKGDKVAYVDTRVLLAGGSWTRRVCCTSRRWWGCGSGWG